MNFGIARMITGPLSRAQRGADCPSHVTDGSPAAAGFGRVLAAVALPQRKPPVPGAYYRTEAGLPAPTAVVTVS